MKLFVVYASVALAIGLGFLVIYLSFAEFFAVAAKELDTTEQRARDLQGEPRETSLSQPVTGATAQNRPYQTTAGAGK